MLLLSIIIVGVSINSRLKSVAPTTRWPDFLLRDSNINGNPNLIRLVAEKNACRPNPCMNDGQCVETSDGYRCYCKHGFIGKDCEGQFA